MYLVRSRLDSAFSPHAEDKVLKIHLRYRNEHIQEVLRSHFQTRALTLDACDEDSHEEEWKNQARNLLDDVM